MSDMAIAGGAMGVQPAGGNSWQAPEAAQAAQAPEPPQEQDNAQRLSEMLEEARKKAEERRDSLKVSKSSSQYGDAAMIAYARLARARNQGEVNSAAGYARRRIAQFQAELRGDEENSERIKAAIRQLQKAVGRAGKKKRELEREQLVKARQRRAQAEKQRGKAAGLGQELARRKTMRMIRETGYLREAEVDNRLQNQLAATRMELRTQAQELSAALAPSLGGAAQGYAGQAAEAAPAPAASVGGVDVVV